MLGDLLYFGSIPFVLAIIFILLWRAERPRGRRVRLPMPNGRTVRAIDYGGGLYRILDHDRRQRRT